MNANDKCGMGAGLLALGLAGGIILLAQLLPDGLPMLPHREMVKPEAIFDGILFAIGFPAGVYLLYKGATAKEPADTDPT